MNIIYWLLLISSLNSNTFKTNSQPQMEAAVCGNSICESSLGENCETCPGDCPCDLGSECVTGVCTPIIGCGNLYCESFLGESCGNCPGDCPCPPGQICNNGICTYDTTGFIGVNNLNPKTALDISGALSHRSLILEATNDSINIPVNVSFVQVTGYNPFFDSIIVFLPTTDADGQRLIIQNKTTVPLYISSGFFPIKINQLGSAEFINTSFSGWSQLTASPQLGLPASWQLEGNNNTIPEYNFLGTIDNSSLAFRTNNTERLRIKDDGKIGIATSTPEGILQINSKATGSLPTLNLMDSTLNNFGGPYIQFTNLNNSHKLKIKGSIGTQANGSDTYFDFFRNSNTLMTLRGDGNLGIGVLDPVSRLVVNSPNSNLLSLQNSNPLANGITNSIHFGGENYSTGFISTIGQSNSNARMGFFTGYSFTGGASFMLERLSISNTGNVGIGETNPDEKLEVNGNLNINDGGLKLFDDSQLTTNLTSKGNLKIKGKLNIGNDTISPYAGSIRWNEIISDFEGYTGTAWVSLTNKGGGGGWSNEINEFGKYTSSDINEPGSHQFGFHIDIDNNYAIIGAPYKDVGSNLNQGRAYIFKYSNNNWVEEAILSSSDGTAGDFFGVSVAIHGEYAAVGANAKQIGGYANHGKVYFFKRTGNLWNEQYNLAPSDGYTDDYFGSAIDLYGEYAVVSAPYKDLNPSNPFQNEHGKVYVFKRTGTTWSEESSVAASDFEHEARFGYSLSLDSVDLIVGSPNHDSGGFDNCGKAYIYKREGTIWNEVLGIIPSDPYFNDNFGTSVSIINSQAIVGAPGKHINFQLRRGKVYIYKRTLSTWEQEASITPSDPEAEDLFGSSVDIYSNFAIVGAEINYSNVSKPGKAYIFSRNGSSWLESKKLVSSDSENSDRFGRTVAISNNYAFVGAPRINSLDGQIYFFKK